MLKKKKWFPFSPIHYRAAEVWLNLTAREGWRLEKLFLGTAHFIQDENPPRYAVTLWNSEGTKQAGTLKFQEYCDFVEDLGWTLAAQHGYLKIYSAEAGAPPLATDPAVERMTLRRLFNWKFAGLLLLYGLLLLFQWKPLLAPGGVFLLLQYNVGTAVILTVAFLLLSWLAGAVSMAVFFLKVKKEGGVIPPDEEQMPAIYKTRRRFHAFRQLMSGLLVALILAGATVDTMQNQTNIPNTNGVERAVIPVPPSALVLEIEGETPVRNSLTETRTPLLQKTRYYQDVADGRFWTSYCYDCKFPFVAAGIYKSLIANPPYGGKKHWPEDFQSIGFPGADRAALYPDGTLLALQRGNRVLLIKMGLISRKYAVDVMDYARPIGQLLEKSGA